jgi:hypothetical protein
MDTQITKHFAIVKMASGSKCCFNGGYYLPEVRNVLPACGCQGFLAAATAFNKG